MAIPSIDISVLAKLEPISTLSESRLKELAGLSFVEKVSKDMDPLRMNITKSAQAIYLLNGELGLRYTDGSKKVMRGDSEAAKHPIDAGHLALQDTIALTDIDIIRIDTDLLDIMMTWDQLADMEKPGPANSGTRGAVAWMTDTGTFSVEKLQQGVFSRLPPANIEEMFHRMEPVQVKAGQVLIRQGAEGDYYYLIEKGVAVVTRKPDPAQPEIQLAELHEGDTFGEEALVSDNKRNATVTMKTDGLLMRLSKADFIELLKAPLLMEVSMEEAKKAVAIGSVWLDVRMPSEFSFEPMPGAINLPLNQIREKLATLDKSMHYVVYCQTGRRSSAAAFILAEHGYRVIVLKSGLSGKR
jgi:rhodanese-related sulfurtransferase